MNVTVVKNPDQRQMQQIKTGGNTKYVIVKAAAGGKPTGAIGDQLLSEITIGGKNYKIDTEFKLNELVKDNENASAARSSVSSIMTGNRLIGVGGVTGGARDILVAQLPSILKRTMAQRNGAPTTIKIMNVIPNNSTKAISSATTNVAKILPKPASKQHVISSLPSISLQVQEQIRTSMTNGKNNTKPSVTLPTNGPVKPIQLVRPHKVSLPGLSVKKRGNAAVFPGNLSNTTSVTQLQRAKNPSQSIIKDKNTKKDS